MPRRADSWVRQQRFLMNHKDVIFALQQVGLGVLEAVEAGGEVGAPAGVLYATMQTAGATLNQFNSFMDGLVSKGMLTLDDSHCYHLTKEGHHLKSKLTKQFAARADVSAPLQATQ